MTGGRHCQAGRTTATTGRSLTADASLMFGHRYGAGFILNRWALPEGKGLVLLQIGEYISF